MKSILIFSICLFLLPFVSADIVINEIMYNPSGADNNHEWIEIYNNGDEEINLEGWRFFEADSNHRLILEQGDNMIISNDEYIVIVQDTNTFLEDYEGYEGTILDSSFSLNNNGEFIAMRNSDGDIADEVEYSSEWGGGNGISLELINSNLDNNVGDNWGSSENEGGTPGEQNSIFERQELLEQIIRLNRGWNLISSYLIPNNLNIENIFNPLVQEGNLILVKDGNGRFFSPIANFNNIPEWEPQKAYYVKVNRDTSFIIEGLEFVNPEIQLIQGWNYISYPDNETRDMDNIIEEVLAPLIEEEQLDILKDGRGRFFIPRWNFNNIPRMHPGKGYMIKVIEDCIIEL